MTDQAPCRPPARWAVFALAALLTASACGAPTSEEDGAGPWSPRNNEANNGDGTNNGANNANHNTNNSDNTLEGRQLYAELCADCHGDNGRGHSGPTLWDWDRGRDALVAITDATMPYGEPEVCEGACAEAVASFILATFVDPGGDNNTPLVCDGLAELPTRRIRLLTRREYAATVRDLLQQPAARCSSLRDCDLRHQTCEAGACADLPCDVKTFYFDPQGARYSSVHVAGEFNAWPATVATGGWAMAWDADLGLWITQRSLDPGTFQYKFVANNGERWFQDTSNPEGAPDGFGGQNSLLQVDCAAASSGALAGLTASFPPETRPEGFPFDTAADTGNVTAVHIEEYLKAAERLADEVASSDGLLPCPAALMDAACARTLLEGFGAQAWRRPLEAAELDRLLGLFTAQGRRADGLRVMLTVLFSAPSFLYRFEVGEAVGDGTFRLTAWETASLLSYTFWGTMPDTALFDAARAGELATDQGLEAQARRLLGDPRAENVIGEFALQWLGVEKILTTNKNQAMFPDFDVATRQAMAEETRQFVSHVVFGSSHKYDELLLADYTFANDRLAGIYGLSGVSGSALRRVTYPDGQRSGLLGHASVLASYAHSDQSSPILRGLFVRNKLLCQSLGAPPPNAGGVPEVDPNATTRERFRQHTADPFCHSCHQFIDDVGFGFERFDAIGQLRQVENGQPIDATGNMNDVEGLYTDTDAPYANEAELAAILADSQAARSCFTRQYLRFVIGELEDDADACTLRALDDRFAETDGDIQALMIAVTTSDTFVLRRPTP